jgi:hypothetical protein
VSAQHVLAPNPVPYDDRPRVFLAGSIEMGVAEDWQAKVVAALADIECVIVNPRRDFWNRTEVLSASNPAFREQVEWELQGLRDAHVIAMYLQPGTKSPVSLLEYGLNIGSRMYVCCPEGFWRKGNVDIVAEQHGIPVYDNFETWLTAVHLQLQYLSSQTTK